MSPYRPADDARQRRGSACAAVLPPGRQRSIGASTTPGVVAALVPVRESSRDTGALAELNLERSPRKPRCSRGNDVGGSD
jgi:hypothetical protein